MSARRTVAQAAIGVAGLAASATYALSGSVARWESGAFGAVNRLPDGLFRPGWVVMQAGTLGSVGVCSATAYAAGDRRLAARLLLSGTTTWALAKAVKRLVGRGRPAALLAGTRTRGAAATGLGYASGHAGVVTALASAALPALRPAGRLGVAALVPTVGVMRVYVGAHLPLDVVGGVALGLAVDAAVGELQRKAVRVPATRERRSGRAPRSADLPSRLEDVTPPYVLVGVDLATRESLVQQDLRHRASRCRRDVIASSGAEQRHARDQQSAPEGEHDERHQQPGEPG